MKLRFDCSTCERPQSGVAARFLGQVVDVNDKGIYDVTCPRGHQVRYIIANPRHAILFDAAALAFVSGFYRESVATFACSLERALEHFTRWAARLSGVPDIEFTRAWTFSAKQTERQLGMFLFAHLALCRTSPAFSRRELEELAARRNAVVHAGAIVDRKAAEQFATEVYNVIAALESSLHDFAGAAYSKQTLRQWEEILLSEEEGATLVMYPLLLVGASQDDDFRARLRRFEDENIWIRG